MERFNDSSYDGVVLKIPSWFIGMNNLDSCLENLKKQLEDCKLSLFYPDHVNNIYELDNYKVKVEREKENAQRKRDAIKKREELEAKILAGEMHELEWVKENRYLDREEVRVGGEILRFDDFFTNKLNVKADFTKKMKSLLKTREDILDFAKQNCSLLEYDMRMCPDSFIDLDFSFYCTRSASLGITYKRLNVRTDIRKTKSGFRYRLARVVQFDDGVIGIDNGGNLEKAQRLGGYKKHNLYLVKT